MKLDHDLDPAEPGEAPQMRRQLHIAVPGEQRAQRPAEGKAVELGIGNRDRLHRQRPAVGEPSLSDAEEGAVERQGAVAGIAGPLWEQHPNVARRPAISSRWPAALCGRRSTKTVRCRRASVPKSGQPFTSDLAMKQIGIRVENTSMSI